MSYLTTSALAVFNANPSSSCSLVELLRCSSRNYASSLAYQRDIPVALPAESKCKEIEVKGNFPYFIESDEDRQLLISIPFSCNISLHCIVLVVASSADESKHNPRLLKLFKNNSGLDFNEAELSEPTQEIGESDPLDSDAQSAFPHSLNISTACSDGQYLYVTFGVKPLIWRCTRHLSILVDDNFGGDTSKLRGLVLLGQRLLEK